MKFFSVLMTTALVSVNSWAAPSKIKISFVGDILFHKPLTISVMNSPTQKFSQLWEKTIPFFQASDFTYGNLEGPVARGIYLDDWVPRDAGEVGFVYDDKVYTGDKFLFNFHPNVLDDLKASGFDLISTANNHTKDRREIGVDKTIDSMLEKKMNFIGTRKAADRTQGPLYNFHRITQIKDFRVGWVACTEALNGFPNTHAQTLLCFQQAKEISAIIKMLKNDEKVDIVIVTPHWGVEYAKFNTLQSSYANLFLDDGADAIIGSHPHVLQDVAQYRTKDGRDTFIAYSLGNFISGQKKDPKVFTTTPTAEEKAKDAEVVRAGTLARQASAIVFLEFEKDQGKVRISNYNYQPIRFDLQTMRLTIPTDATTLNHIEASMSRKKIPLAK